MGISISPFMNTKNGNPDPSTPNGGGHARRQCNNLHIDHMLLEFVDNELLPGSGVDSETFWQTLAILIKELGPENRALLAERDKMQKAIDDWHGANPFEPQCYRGFLTRIGYLEPDPANFSVSTSGVDPEIATIAGPQLVVPVQNARFALNAANARWGSLYDALYGTDAIAAISAEVKGYDPVRGAAVMDWGRGFLDRHFPLQDGSHRAATAYRIDGVTLEVILEDGVSTQLREVSALKGYTGPTDTLSSLLLHHHGLHVELQFDADHLVGRDDKAHIKDIVLESAVTAIQDLEDSVAAVDAGDKTLVYRNLLGLYRGDLEARFSKGGKPFARQLNPDRSYLDLEGEPFTLPGRSLLLARNVGFLMTTPAVLDEAGNEIPEGILDALVTAVAGMHDLNKSLDAAIRNSKTGSIYIVKPKMHGPKEVAFCGDLFGRIEALLGLDRNTLKLGIMDEERRTTLNLKACIKAAKERIIFINTGFLDRTGDEIHTSMAAGPMVPKEAMKEQPWLARYEQWNVSVGLECGLAGVAQIGKGMWPKPDEMAEMLAAKGAQLNAGASCAWVPSPTAATLHATHYHEVDVQERQRQLTGQGSNREELLQIPLLTDPSALTPEAIQRELDNNAQGILGYVVRWIDQGIGCSKVPNIHNVALMEDRATLRISSQHMANWLRHSICTREQVAQTFEKMAKVVDQQNSADRNYCKMSDNFSASIAYQTAVELVFQGASQPNGYTEPMLHHARLLVKAQEKKVAAQ